MDTAAFDALTEKLIDTATRDPDVLGIILAGSTAALARRDRWSDHDFLWVVRPGLQERYRRDPSWLPDADRIVLHYRETEHGLNVIYEDGHLIEFAVFDPDEVSGMKANDYAVPVDKADIRERMRAVETNSAPRPLDVLGAVQHCMQLIFAGASRCARGEKISAHAFIRMWAFRRLLQVLPAVMQPENAVRLDTLDPFRRIEQVLPTQAAQLDALLRLDVLDAADAMLDLLDAQVRPHLADEYPTALALVVRRRIDDARQAS